MIKGPGVMRNVVDIGVLRILERWVWRVGWSEGLMRGTQAKGWGVRVERGWPKILS